MVLIRITGKAKDVFGAIKQLVQKYGGNTPVTELKKTR